ncbi:hypothetical protein QQP08_013863 [Theobroma cacao]|nr:hypothetical protein QQP08_013863 [Theobroma cacao]
MHSGVKVVWRGLIELLNCVLVAIEKLKALSQTVPVFIELRRRILVSFFGQRQQCSALARESEVKSLMLVQSVSKMNYNRPIAIIGQWNR